MAGSMGVQLRSSNYTPRNVGRRFNGVERDWEGADVHVHGEGEKSSSWSTIFFPSGTLRDSHIFISHRSV